MSSIRCVAALEEKIDSKESIMREVYDLDHESRMKNRVTFMEKVDVLKMLASLHSGNTKLKNQLRRVLSLTCREKPVIDYIKLRDAYWEVSDTLNLVNKGPSRKTVAERIFSQIIKKNDKHHVEYGFWIMNHNVDLFYPQFNLIIEIDGGVHSLEAKMRKDEFRDKNITNYLNIPIYAIDNCDVKREAR